MKELTLLIILSFLLSNWAEIIIIGLLIAILIKIPKQQKPINKRKRKIILIDVLITIGAIIIYIILYNALIKSNTINKQQIIQVLDIVSLISLILIQVISMLTYHTNKPKKKDNNNERRNI